MSPSKLASSGTVDLMAALRASIERAKAAQAPTPVTAVSLSKLAQEIVLDAIRDQADVFMGLGKRLDDAGMTNGTHRIQALSDELTVFAAQLEAEWGSL